MGNSPKIVRDHYAKVIEHMDDKKAAREYWSIKPIRDDCKIIAIR